MHLFIARYRSSIVAVLIPMILKVSKCNEILIEIASMCKREPASLLKDSFAKAFAFAYIYHSPEIAKKCVMYMQKDFGANVVSDVILSSEVIFMNFVKNCSLLKI